MKKLLIILSQAAVAFCATLSSQDFAISIDDTNGAILEISDPKADGDMNWVSSPDNAPWQPLGSRWGLGYADLGGTFLHRTYWTNPKTTASNKRQHTSTYTAGPLELTVSRSIGKDDTTFTESYTFENKGSSSLDLSQRDDAALAIFTPFNDHYTNTTDALNHRSHAHVWANGGSNAWVKLNQMGGYGHNLGLVLTQGALRGYSIESRDAITMSNTRGVFLLHPNIEPLEPGESSTIEWTFFWHSDWDDFFSKCAKHSDQFIKFDIDDYTLVLGEETDIEMRGAVNEQTTVNGGPVNCTRSLCSFEFQAKRFGEQSLDISTPSNNGVHNSTIYLNVVPQIDDLISNRTHYIIENQQLSDAGDPTDGAYVVFDTESLTTAFWDKSTDRNPGRERVGMGILMSRWLRKHPEDDRVRESLERYYSYVSINLQEEDGYVLNAPGDRRQRLYNWPWVMQLHISVAALDLNLTGPVAAATPLERFERTLENFYDQGGDELYAIGLPILESLRFLEKHGHKELYERAKSLFIRHGGNLLRRGLDYPAFEVNFEQSIVAPATVTLLELYRSTGNETWLNAAKLHLETLLRFEGEQPNYRLHNVAIRHWDGYWFGKERLWGDTFPHYWSTLDAIALSHYSRAKKGDDGVALKKRADGILRANLALFEASGKASCAWVYPLTINGRKGHHKDAYANDQDWALNHLLYLEEDDAFERDQE